jgi:hypothetical protein
MDILSEEELNCYYDFEMTMKELTDISGIPASTLSQHAKIGYLGTQKTYGKHRTTTDKDAKVYICLANRSHSPNFYKINRESYKELLKKKGRYFYDRFCEQEKEID